MNEKVKQTMVRARAAMILDQPFFGALALRLLMKEDTGCDTLWVDGVTLGYNPAFIETCNMDEIKGLMAHEVLHLSLAHHCRRGDRDPKEWNDACDYAINHIVLNAGMVLPKGGLVDDAFKDMAAETIFDKIRQRKKQGDNGAPDPNGKPQQGQQPQPQPGQGQGNQPGQGQGQGKPQPIPGEVRDLPGNDGNAATQAQKDINAQDWQVAATQAAQSAKGCGKLPGGIMELIEQLNEPKVNWREALQRFVEQQAKNDYTFRRVNARFAGRGICLPSLHSESLPPIKVAVDSSCSVTKEDLEDFATEIDDILTHYDTRIDVIYCDTRVNGGETFTKENRPVKLNVKGRGGTAFSPVFSHIASDPDGEGDPLCVIYFSDMDCDDFGPAPHYPVLWIQTEGRKKVVPFGEVIKMKR